MSQTSSSDNLISQSNSLFSESIEESSNSSISVKINTNKEEKLFDEHIPISSVKAIMDKQKTTEEIINTKSDLDDFNFCFERLKKGIEVVKHNYSNENCKVVNLRISNDMKTLYYEAIDLNPNFFKKVFKVKSKMKLSNMFGVVYGAISSTFEKKRSKAMKNIKDSLKKQKK